MLLYRVLPILTSGTAPFRPDELQDMQVILVIPVILQTNLPMDLI